LDQNTCLNQVASLRQCYQHIVFSPQTFHDLKNFLSYVYVGS